MNAKPSTITLRAFALGAFFAAFFAWLTVGTYHRLLIEVTATQVPVLPYVLLFLMVLAINPLCHLIRLVRPFTIAEILVVFIMGMVSSGLSTYGLTDQLFPLAGSLLYKDWNTEQAQWDRYIQPYLNERYFLSVPGIQTAAIDNRDALDRRDSLKNAYEKATTVDSKELALKEVESQAGAQRETAIEVLAARDSLTKAREAWTKHAQENKVEDYRKVLESYPELLRAQEKVVAQKRAALQALNEQAFAKVERFRRGLPQPLQAYPGIAPMPEDDTSSYFGRLNRLLKGKSALSQLQSAEQLLATKGEAEAIDDVLAQALTPRFKAALDKLSPLDSSSELASAKATLESELDAVTKNLAQTDTDLSDLNRTERWAMPAEQAALKTRIAGLSRNQIDLTADKKRVESRLKANTTQRSIAAQIVAAASDLRTLDEQVRAEQKPAAGVLRVKLNQVMARFPAFDVSYQRYLFGEVPWSDWFGPLLRWGLLLVLTYIILMAFNVLIFRQWAHNEKLIYPLVEFPEILVGHKDSKPGVVPEVFRSGLFWLGFAISATTLSWNLLAYSQVIPGLEVLDLKNFWTPYIQGTSFKGLMPSARSAIFFTMIGLSFLIPARVSFSLWFFRIFYMVELLILVWLGYGESEESFPKEWYCTMNLMTGQGGGALLIFASVVLYKCRKYLACAFYPDSVRDLPLDEQKELRISSFLFLSCSMGLIFAVWLGMGANLFYTIFFYAVIMVVTIGLIRAVTEGGLLGFQCWAGPFHYVRNVLGLDTGFSAATYFTPLMVYYSVFFLDIKTFIAPAMANTLKVRDDLRLERGRFHLSIGAAIALAIVVAGATSLMMCYAQGANAMDSWFYVGFPQGLVSQLKDINANPPSASTPNTLWIAGGAATMALLLYFRQTLFWLPHPIGLIMLVNPIMAAYWFSILLGWLAKHLVTKYGNRETYVRMRALFIGLIVGELVIIALGLYVSYRLNVKIPIDLNRNEVWSNG